MGVKDHGCMDEAITVRKLRLIEMQYLNAGIVLMQYLFLY